MYPESYPADPEGAAAQGAAHGDEYGDYAEPGYGHDYVEDDFVDSQEFYEEAYSMQLQPASYSSYMLPEVIRNFLLYFRKKIVEQDVYEINSIYESSFNRLTERFFQTQPWPPAEAVAPYVNNDPVFLILYRELCYRHVYSKLQPTLEDRFNSYENYCDLFNYILNSPQPVDLQLPNQWLWDIIDEFIYQFQAFCQYRAKLKSKTDEELNRLRMNPQIWNVHSVLNVLHSLVQKVNAGGQLAAAPKEGDTTEVAGDYGTRALYKMLGYFSMIGLLRMHCLLGDYYLALRMMEHVELGKKGLFTRVTACHVTTYYYVGFSYLMMRRYHDAIKAFSHLLSFLSRTKQYHSRTYPYEQIAKRSDQTYALLAIAISLHSQRVDESINSYLREAYGDRINRMQRGDEPCFEELFTYACPKFISASAPDYGTHPLQNLAQDPLKHQLRLFMMEIRQQTLVPGIRSLLKLYTTMSVSKLSTFLDMEDEEFRMHLLCYKHKTRSMAWERGPLLRGELRSTADLDFFIKDDMLHISESKVARRYADFFLRHINKFDEAIAHLKGH